MIPYRICCGKQHIGPICPDNKVMCCYCFERVTQDDLAIENGIKVDVCWPCFNWEQEELWRRGENE